MSYRTNVYYLWLQFKWNLTYNIKLGVSTINSNETNHPRPKSPKNVYTHKNLLPPQKQKLIKWKIQTWTPYPCAYIKKRTHSLGLAQRGAPGRRGRRRPRAPVVYPLPPLLPHFSLLPLYQQRGAHFRQLQRFDDNRFLAHACPMLLHRMQLGKQNI